MVSIFKRWWREEDGLAAVEASFIFPIMLALFLGVFDVGNAIITNQKTVRASQVVADLIARGSSVSNSDLEEAVEAGRLAFEPLNSSSYGVDIVSVRFDDDENAEIVWRETRNMTALPDALSRVESLAASDEGVVMVAVHYEYVPTFGQMVIDAFDMQEVAFSRGRRTAVVSRVE